MKKILALLFEHKTLDRETAKEVLVNIGKAGARHPENPVVLATRCYALRKQT